MEEKSSYISSVQVHTLSSSDSDSDDVVTEFVSFEANKSIRKEKNIVGDINPIVHLKCSDKNVNSDVSSDDDEIISTTLSHITDYNARSTRSSDKCDILSKGLFERLTIPPKIESQHVISDESSKDSDILLVNDFTTYGQERCPVPNNFTSLKTHRKPNESHEQSSTSHSQDNSSVTCNLVTSFPDQLTTLVKCRKNIEAELPDLKEISNSVNEPTTTSDVDNKLEEKPAKQKQQKSAEERATLRKQRIENSVREKALKDSERNARKQCRPGECLKFVKAVIDKRIILKDDGVEHEEITKIFKNENSRIIYEVKEQIISNSITWMREINQHYFEDDDDCQLSCLSTWKDEDQVMVVINMSEFASMIDAFKRHGNTSDATSLTIYDYTDTVRACYPSVQNITYVIRGAEIYFRSQKSKETQTFKRNVLGTEQSRHKRKHNSVPVISHIDMEEVIVDLQVRTPDCNLRFIKNSNAELASLIVNFTKAIAESPFKKEQTKNQFKWYVDADSKNTVRVDRNGRFLIDLWLLQIQCFTNVATDTAQAIEAEYPTPQSLLKAYEKSNSEREARLLLQNILVRRGVGPLATSRRVGPELSKKIHALLTCPNGETILHNLH